MRVCHLQDDFVFEMNTNYESSDMSAADAEEKDNHVARLTSPDIIDSVR